MCGDGLAADPSVAQSFVTVGIEFKMNLHSAIDGFKMFQIYTGKIFFLLNMLKRCRKNIVSLETGTIIAQVIPEIFTNWTVFGNA